MLEPPVEDIEVARSIPLPVDSDEMSDHEKCPFENCDATFNSNSPLCGRLFDLHIERAHPKPGKKVDRTDLDTVTTGTGEMSMHSWKVWQDNFQVWKTKLCHKGDMGWEALLCFPNAKTALSLRRTQENWDEATTLEDPA